MQQKICYLFFHLLPVITVNAVLQRSTNRASDTSNTACHSTGSNCSQTDSIGTKCLAIIGDESDLEENDTPENAKKVRDCICNGSYWGHFNA